MKRAHIQICVLALGVASGCGEGSGIGTTNSTNPTGPSEPNTIVITVSGMVSPPELTVTAGTTVTFRNNDGRSHEMASDPHPDHTDCPEINSAGFLGPGQSRQTAILATPKTCGYHDHELPTNTFLQGRIIVR